MKRNFLFYVSVLLITSAIVMAGCAAPTPTASPTPTPKVTPTLTPTASPTPTPSPKPTPTPVVSKPAGTLVIAAMDIGSEVWNSTQPGTTQWVISSCQDYLFYKDERGNPIPGLAQSWDVSPDYLAYTFHLRKGIQFHNGWGEFTADDVKFSYELGSQKGTQNSSLPLWAAVMDKVEVVDPYTVVFRFKKPTITFMSRAGREHNPSFSIFSKKYFEKVGVEEASRKPIGTGPYKFVEHQFGEYIKFEAVENHWRKTPAFKTLIIKKVPEEASRVNMLRAGEVDIIDISLDFKPEVVKAGFKTKSIPGSLNFIVCLGGQWLPTKETFDAKYPWVGDSRDPQSMERALKVRKALNLAVNRDEIVSTILQGEAQTLAVPLAVPGNAMYDSTIKPYPYDPEQAKKLLAEAGYPNGFDITMKLLAYVGRPEGVPISQAVAMMWQKIGVNVKQEPIDYPTFKPTVMARKTNGMAWCYGGVFYDDPVTGYLILGYSGCSLPLLGFEAANLDKLIDEANAEPDDAKRAKQQREMAKVIYDNYWMVPIAIKSSMYALSSRVGEWPRTDGAPYLGNFENITYGPGFKP